MGMNIKINRDTQEVEIRFDNQVIIRKIWQDEFGREFFNVPNLLNNPKRMSNQLFHHRIKDAVDTIRNGDADVISRVDKFGLETVVRYIDRDYGEKVREQFLEGWKDAKFAHIVLASGCFTLDIKGNIAPEPHQFKTQEEAENYISNIHKKMNAVFKEYMQLPKSERNAFYEKLFSQSSYSFAEKEYYHFIEEMAFTGSSRFPFKIAQMVV